MLFYKAGVMSDLILLLKRYLEIIISFDLQDFYGRLLISYWMTGNNLDV